MGIAGVVYGMSDRTGCFLLAMDFTVIHWISAVIPLIYLIFNILSFLFALSELLLGALEERGVADWVKDSQDFKGTQRSSHSTVFPLYQPCSLGPVVEQSRGRELTTSQINPFLKFLFIY